VVRLEAHLQALTVDKDIEAREMTEKSAARSRSSDRRPSNGPADILLVEDNAADARLAAEALKENEFSSRLHWVADGVQAMEFLRGRGKGADGCRPDLILLDLNLPKKDGREVLAELKRDPSLRRIPVVVLTTSRAREDRERSYDLHANCFITKPDQWNDFVDVVRSIKDFWFGPVTLPVAAETATEAALTPALPAAGALPETGAGRAPLRVLLVDDSSRDVRFVREILNEAGQSHIELLNTGSVRQALDRIGREMFDAVLLDLPPPESQLLDGLAALHDRLTNVPIVVLTGLKDEATAARALRQGAQDYLVKGRFDGELLARAIGNAIERTRSQRMLEYLAHHDVLTELPNRTLFEDRLSNALEHAHRNRQNLAVLFLDLDRFKTHNDTLGHAVGDQLLQAVAARLCGCVRASDTVARVGGDEFTILLPEIARPGDTMNVAGKVLECFRSPFPIDGRELTLTASIGVSLYPNDGEDADTLLKNADRAMYNAKEHGRNNLQLYAPVAAMPPSERESLVAALRQALERDELVLHYQPIVDALSTSIVAQEALVSWHHPMGGLLSPQRFLPVAEETGLIIEIGEWVLRRACEQGRAWQRTGLQPLRVAVKASYRQLNQGRPWVDTVARVLRETGFDPSRLELEVAEESFMRNESTAVKTLRTLHEMGVRVSVDNFGTGYASLSRLRCFPFTNVKIDRTFIHDVTINPDDAAIVAAITAMGHSLRMSVLAEGITTPQQVSFLLRHQIDLMQGPYFARPLTGDDSTRLIKARKLLPIRRPGRTF
jgi:diguanylate cyclase (GGDEF)-like protein